MQADLIIYAVVAAGLVFWLRSVLGTRHGDERERPNPFTAPVEPKTRPDFMPEEPGVMSLPTPSSQLPRNASIASPSVEESLSVIAAEDPAFETGRFIQGAQDAFAMIVEAFAAGDMETLNELLEPKVLAAFDSAIRARQARRETMSTEIHAIRKAEIMEARIDKKTIYITVRFIAEETCVIRDSAGMVISGDPDRITDMNDIWTFSRPLRSRDPRWFLHETRDGDVTEDHKTPVPDGGGH